ncbi:MAG: DUF975 family protein [Eubacteriales bacterium]|nr:DUF975 family protein [Eubacteriales bacterium]
MKYKNKDLKAMARDALLGNYTLPIAAQFLLTIGTLFVENVFSVFFETEGTLNMILSTVASFVIVLILNIFDAGFYAMILRISRGESYFFSDLLYFFRNNPDRVIVAGFVFTLIEFMVSIPLKMVLYQTPADVTDLQAVSDWFVAIVLAMIFQAALQVLLSLPFVMTYWVLCDNEEMGGVRALKESCRIMKGRKLSYLGLVIGFIPHMLLAMLTWGIGMLWIIPYMGVSEAFFYRAATENWAEGCKEKQDAEINDYNAEA